MEGLAIHPHSNQLTGAKHVLTFELWNVFPFAVNIKPLETPYIGWVTRGATISWTLHFLTVYCFGSGSTPKHLLVSRVKGLRGRMQDNAGAETNANYGQCNYRNLEKVLAWIPDNKLILNQETELRFNFYNVPTCRIETPSSVHSTVKFPLLRQMRPHYFPLWTELLPTYHQPFWAISI